MGPAHPWVYYALHAPPSPSHPCPQVALLRAAGAASLLSPDVSVVAFGQAALAAASAAAVASAQTLQRRRWRAQLHLHGIYTPRERSPLEAPQEAPPPGGGRGRVGSLSESSSSGGSTMVARMVREYVLLQLHRADPLPEARVAERLRTRNAVTAAAATVAALQAQGVVLSYKGRRFEDGPQGCGCCGPTEAYAVCCACVG